MVQIDPTVHLGDIITAVVGGIIAVIGFGLRQMYHSIRQFVVNVESMERRIEDTAEVVDVHTDALTREGWLRGIPIPFVSKRRRIGDIPHTFQGR